MNDRHHRELDREAVLAKLAGFFGLKPIERTMP